MPFAITAADLDRGQERFNIYCTPCHDQTGNGNGMVVQRGYRQPPSFHIERLKQADPGYFFDVITNGFGAMPDYKAQIDARDRWRIVAYVKALQMAPADARREDRRRCSAARRHPPGAARRQRRRRHRSRQPAEVGTRADDDNCPGCNSRVQHQEQGGLELAVGSWELTFKALWRHTQ